MAECQPRFGLNGKKIREWLARRRRNKTMKRSNAVRGIFWLGMIFAIVFLVRAESGDRRMSMPDTKSAPPIRILDQNGQPAVNGVPSATSTIFDVTVGGGNGFQFVPDTVSPAAFLARPIRNIVPLMI